MNDRQKKRLKGTLTNHSDRLEYLELTLQNERLWKYGIRAFIGLIMLLGGGFYDEIAAFLLKTRYLSFTYSEGVGLVQGALMCIGSLLLIVSACLFDREMQTKH